MRPNRTLPLVLSLAVLAALPLLSGCVEEELEPGYELLEVGPELPEGVSASPDGSIVIGKALAVPEGFTLGEEDWEALAVMNNFECYSIWDCYFNPDPATRPGFDRFGPERRLGGPSWRSGRAKSGVAGPGRAFRYRRQTEA